MISKERRKKVKICITTYTNPPTNKRCIEMSKNYDCGNDNNSRFICSICLNTNAKEKERKLECDRRKSRSCPICQKPPELNADNSCNGSNNDSKNENKLDDISSKNIQTTRTNVDQGLNLLNEVLTVLQSKKEYNTKDGRTAGGRTIVSKDASVSTQFGKTNLSKLTVSKMFQLSIDGGGYQEGGKFSVVNSCQPKVVTRSQCSIDLIKHKSSSIPQMKMEELKKSLKDKTKSNKDAIEEVNRMFATVKRDDHFDNINRPLIRNGPRVLPVVKTDSFCKKCQTQSNVSERNNKQSCKCCQTNYFMSSGDSLAKQQRCERNHNCCHNNHELDIPMERLICERCRKPDYGYD